MKKSISNFKRVHYLMLFLAASFMIMGCKTDPDPRKQQKAFYVDANGDLLNKKDEIVKKKGDFKLEGGFFVDSDGNPIKRDIDKFKEKVNQTVDKTKDAINDTANKTAEGVKKSFNKMFNTKVKGEAYQFTQVTFKEKSHRLTDIDLPEIKGLAEALKEHPASRIQVQVHTSEGKDRADCKKLANLRGQVVRDLLVTYGVDKEQVSVKGLGLTTEDAEKAVANVVEVVVGE